MIKFSIITSIDGVEPLNRAAKMSEKIIIYTIATEESNTIYENILSHIEERFSARYLRIE